MLETKISLPVNESINRKKIPFNNLIGKKINKTNFIEEICRIVST